MVLLVIRVLIYIKNAALAQSKNVIIKMIIVAFNKVNDEITSSLNYTWSAVTVKSRSMIVYYDCKVNDVFLRRQGTLQFCRMIFTTYQTKNYSLYLFGVKLSPSFLYILCHFFVKWLLVSTFLFEATAIWNWWLFISHNDLIKYLLPELNTPKWIKNIHSLISDIVMLL